MGKGILEVVIQQNLRFCNRLFLVKKDTRGSRPLIDMSLLSQFVKQCKFLMEIVSSTFEAIWKDDFMFSTDLKDSFFQIPIHPELRSHLVFLLNSVVYQFKAPCFGLMAAPQVFRIFTVVFAWTYARGIWHLRYIDDWLVFASCLHVNIMPSIWKSGSSASHQCPKTERSSAGNILELSSRIVVIRSDSLVVIVYLKKEGGTGSLPLYPSTAFIEMGRTLQLGSSAWHISSKSSMLTDHISCRNLLCTDRMVTSSCIFDQVCQ